MKKVMKYTLDLTDEQAKHLLIALDGWEGQQRQTTTAYSENDETKDYFIKSIHRLEVAKQLYKTVEKTILDNNQNINIKNAFQEIMFDI